ARAHRTGHCDQSRSRRPRRRRARAACNRVAVAGDRLCEFPVARAGRAAHAAGRGAMSKQMPDFTQGELEWQPWLTPLALAAASAEQRDALKITPSMRA